MSPDTAAWPSYECYGGPLDGERQAVQYEGQWQFAVPLVTSGRYRLAFISGARGQDLGQHWFWSPAREAQP